MSRGCLNANEPPVWFLTQLIPCIGRREMVDLFRFVALRSPERPKAPVVVDLTSGTRFQRDLVNQRTEQNGREERSATHVETPHRAVTADATVESDDPH